VLEAVDREGVTEEKLRITTRWEIRAKTVKGDDGQGQVRGQRVQDGRPVEDRPLCPELRSEHKQGGGRPGSPE